MRDKKSLTHRYVANYSPWSIVISYFEIIMPVSKQKKVEIWADVTKALEAHAGGSVVFVNFHGLSMNETTEVRKQLKREGVSYLVAKKSIVKKILGEKAPKGDMPALLGELAVVYGNDVIAPAREVYNFQKKFDGKLSMLGGIVGGEYKSKEEVISLATIPSPLVLRGMFVNLINSPIQGLVIALNAIAEKKGQPAA